MKIELEIDPILWSFIDTSASDRAHYKGYTLEEMIDSKPQKDQILKWLKEIQQNKMRYKR